MSGSGLGSLMPPHSVWEGLNFRLLCFLMNPTDVFTFIFRYVKEFISSFINSHLGARSFLFRALVSAVSPWQFVFESVSWTGVQAPVTVFLNCLSIF